MPPLPVFRRALLPAWLALVAVLAMALLPTLSHALAWSRSGGGAAWVEVCTPQGMRMVSVDTVSDDTAGSPVSAGGHLEHCPPCALGGDQPPVPPAAPAALPTLALPAAPVPAAFLHAPRTLYVWLAARPRGPPSVS